MYCTQEIIIGWEISSSPFSVHPSREENRAWSAGFTYVFSICAVASQKKFLLRSLKILFLLMLHVISLALTLPVVRSRNFSSLPKSYLMFYQLPNCPYFLSHHLMLHFLRPHRIQTLITKFLGPPLSTLSSLNQQYNSVLPSLLVSTCLLFLIPFSCNYLKE